MSDDNDRAHVREILQTLGLTVSDVPEAKSKRCDFRAHDAEDEQYLIEVKGFHDNADIDEALRKEGIHAGRRSLVRSNDVEKDIEYATRQLENTPGAAEALWLVALINRTRYSPDVASQQILGALYGIRKIVHVDPSGRNVSSDCLYFSHSAFHRHRNLDGAIVIDQDGASFCANDFGHCTDRVRNSALGRVFAQRAAFNDALSLESRGFLWADCPLDRKNENAVLEYVKGKYGLDFALVSAPAEYSATVRIQHAPHPDVGKPGL